MQQTAKAYRILEILIHVIAWVVVFFLPQVIFMREQGLNNSARHILPMLISPVSLAIVFYPNYLWLAPKLLNHHCIKRFVCINLVIYATCTLTITTWHRSFPDFNKHFEDIELIQEPKKKPGAPRIIRPGRINHPEIRPHKMPPHHDMKHIGRTGWRTIVAIIRDILIDLFVTALAIILHMSFRFKKAERAREQIELKQTETELKSLKNQLSPHFLLNTLNNIYALVAFNQEKAQQAIQELSKLLSHILYEDTNSFTTIKEEVEFLNNYIELMKLRMSDNVEVEFNTSIINAENMPIASLLFISQVENAFKHGTGISNSRISISIEANQECNIIKAVFRNTNNPKTSNDKSGHGVGLQLLQRRLDLLYPNKYIWVKGVDETTNEYYSNLTIKTS